MGNQKPGRKKHVPVAYQGNDEHSGESIIYEAYRRRGDLDIFYQYNPEHIMIQAEEAEERAARRECEIQRAQEDVAQIFSHLKKKQRVILTLKLEDKTFREIAEITGYAERTVYYHWKKIKKIAWQVLRSE